MKRIGILGGTFNPIHVGHLAIAETVCDRLKLDKVLFIPSYRPPHKSGKNVVGANHRLKMIKLAIKGNLKFTADDFEIKQAKKSYSIHTLEHLKKQYSKGTTFFFIIGSDMLPGLSKWKDIKKLIKLTEFVAVTRKGYSRRNTKYKIRVIQALDFGVSSSLLRKYIKDKKSVKYLLPDSVLTYIKRHKLYT